MYNKNAFLYSLLQTNQDKHHMGPVEYYPPEGFPLSYFPYTQKPSFRPPLVMVQFTNPKPDVPVSIQCHVHAQNIDTIFKDMYTNTFHLIMDEVVPQTESIIIHYGPTQAYQPDSSSVTDDSTQSWTTFMQTVNTSCVTPSTVPARPVFNVLPI